VTISIIICTRNRAHELKRTLTALKDVNTDTDYKLELIVVDNGSSDDTKSIIASTNLDPIVVRYAFQPQRGQVKARNLGLREAKGDVIVFTDDDVRPKPEWLRELTLPIIQGDCDATVGAVRIAPHLLRPWMTEQHKTFLASSDNIDHIDPIFATGANFSFSKRVLKKVPQFDPELGPGQLGFWDDCLFSLQIRKAGFRLRFAPNAIVDHHFLEDRLLRSSFLERAYAEGKCRAYIAWHWDHLKVFPHPTLHTLRKRLRLTILRIVRNKDCRRLEGAAGWEMNLLSQIGYFKQLAIEQQRARLYDKGGLEKKQCNPR
jgi:glycosyltransferase involved in cell wall biosynthesis